MNDGQPAETLNLNEKLFLQRLIASHSLTDDEARNLYKEIYVSSNEEEEGPSDRVFSKFLGSMNTTLVSCMDFEIKTTNLHHAIVSPPPNVDNEKDAEDDDNKNKAPFTKYHALVNRSDDISAKLKAAHNKTPHDVALFRLIVEKLVELGNDIEETEDNDNEDEEEEEEETTSRSSTPNKRKRRTMVVQGCRGYMNRMDLLNLRHDLKGVHEGKLTVSATEDIIHKLEEEKWLVPKTNTLEEEEEDDDVGSSGKKRSRRKKIHYGDDVDGGGEDTKLQIGPRTYMELSELLMDLGVTHMPQFILHRGR